MGKIVKRLWLWSAVGVFSMFLLGCSVGGGELLQTDRQKESPTEEEHQESLDTEREESDESGEKDLKYQEADTEAEEESSAEDAPEYFPERKTSDQIWKSLYALPGEQLQAVRRRDYRLRQEKIRRILEGDVSLPKRYDARQEGRTAQVEDQKDLGTCWSFASLTALENRLLPQEKWDFSEDHMSHNPNFALEQKSGGEYTMSMAYLLAWLGPVTEEEDPYGDGFSPENLCPVKHVQEVRILPAGDQEMIKRGVLACGGVQSSLYTTMQNSQSRSEHYNEVTYAYCYPEKRAHNHDIVIVGWDDDFPKEAFRTEVPGNGAFLCENSWGTEFGENGFFYVSYYDANLGETNIIYTGVENTDNYSDIYQSDLCGWIGQMGYGEDTAWAANIYTARQAEQVAAVGFYATGENTAYEIYVKGLLSEKPASALKDRGEALAKGSLSQAGYYTIPLEKMVEVEAGERFAVIIRVSTPQSVHPIAIEYDPGDGKSHIDLEDGEGYISYEGTYWESAEEKQNCNICLKAYTCVRESRD